MTIFVTAIFLLQYFHHLLHTKYRIVQIINEAKKSTNGSIPESNTFKNEGEGVNPYQLLARHESVKRHK